MMIKLWVVIGTCSKIKEAKLQMELIRKIRTPLFEDIKIVHTYNGPEDYIQELEDELIIIDNPGHYIWAANLMDVWIEAIMKYDVDYIVVSSADCWRILPEKIKHICNEMKAQNKHIATCVRWYPWQLDRRKKWLACDTFILDAKKEYEHPIFPLKAQEFRDNNSDMLLYYWWFKIEKVLATRYIQSVMKYVLGKDIDTICDNGIYHLTKRVPTMKSSWRVAKAERNFDCVSLWLYTNHDFTKKRNILKDKTWI